MTEIQQMWDRELSKGCLAQFLRCEEVLNGETEKEEGKAEVKPETEAEAEIKAKAVLEAVNAEGV